MLDVLVTVGDNKMTYCHDHNRRSSEFYNKCRSKGFSKSELEKEYKKFGDEDPYITPTFLNFSSGLKGRDIERSLNFEGKTCVIFLDWYTTRSYDRKTLLKCCQLVRRGFTHNYVYTLHGDKDEVLYIGETHDLDSRLASHYKTKSWWHEVKRVSFEAVENKSAVAVEKELIKTNNPKYNINHNKVRSPRPKMPSFTQTTEYLHLNEKEMV